MQHSDSIGFIFILLGCSYTGLGKEGLRHFLFVYKTRRNRLHAVARTSAFLTCKNSPHSKTIS